MSDDLEGFKEQAADRAVEFIESGMVVGLGHGSTAILALRRLAERLRSRRVRDVAGVPCSRFVEAEASRLGIPLTTLEAHPVLDLTIDGADEVDPKLDLIKGRGGALLREKIVAQASRRLLIVVDETKLSPVLGTLSTLPVEVVPFALGSVSAYLETLGVQVTPRKTDEGAPWVTELGNRILDCRFGRLDDPGLLAAKLDERAGVVEHGLFLGLATNVIVAGKGGVRHLLRSVTGSNCLEIPAADPTGGPRQ